MGKSIVNSKNLDELANSADLAVGSYAPRIENLDEAERDLAMQVIRAVEWVGGRGEAARIMDVGPTTIDNYRLGNSQPKAIALSKLLGAEAQIRTRLLSAARSEGGRERRELGEDGPVEANSSLPKVRLVSSYDPDSDQNEEGYSHETWKPRVPGARPEIDARLGAGEGSVGQMLTIGSNGGTSGHRVVAEWLLPEAFLVGEMKASASTTIVMEVVGDSMIPSYQPGDRVLVDLAQTRMVADTVYAISDGFSEPQIKRLQRIPFSDPPRVSIISDNPALANFDVDLEKLHIIGRICGVIARR